MTLHSNTLSVIIPVYNCQRFIAKTIASVVAQPQVTEIVVVDDGSTDQSWPLLQQLQQDFSLLKLYQHPKGVNKGRSATRNLGIQKATGDYVAFLDADDYYLENRFDNDFKIFESNPNCDGVYNAAGYHFYRAVSEHEEKLFQLDTMRKDIAPDFLFEALLSGKYGFFHIDGLTVKKTVFKVTGLFNENLMVSEDSDLFWKMALKINLFGSVLDKAIANRGIHDSNIFDRADLYQVYVIKMYESLISWSATNQVPLAKIDLLLKWIWLLKFKQNKGMLHNIGYWMQLFSTNLRLLFTYLSVKYFPIIRQRQILFPFLYR